MRRLAMVAALAAMLACGVVAGLMGAADARRDAAQDVDRANQALATSELLERHVVDLETGLRAYLPTGDRIFLTPWYSARGALPADFSTLGRLAEGRRAPTAELSAIRRSVSAYTQDYAVPLIATAPIRDGGRLDAVTRQGKQLVDGLRGQLADFDGLQLARRKSAEDELAAAANRFSIVAIAGMVGLVIVLTGLLLYVRRLVIVPVRRVIAACAELARGARQELEVSGAPELRRLASAFNAMASELERRERALLDRERMLAQSQTIAHIGSWELDLSEERMTWSDELCRIAGVPLGSRPTTAEFLAQVHRDDRALLENQVQSARDGAESHSEYRIVRPDGDVRHVHTARFARLDERGKVTHLYGTTQDITDRVARERQLRQFASIVEHTAEAITGQDAAGTITEWNAGAERIYGYSAAEAIGQPMSLIEAPDRRGEEARLLERALAEDTIQQFQTERRRKDGAILQVSITVSPVRDHQGKPVGASVVTRDVSARRQAERERENALSELAEAQRIARVGSWTWDVETGETTWSEEMFRIFGRETSDGPATGEAFLAYVHPDEREAVADRYARGFEDGTTFEVGFRIVVGDGEIRALHAHGRREGVRYLGTIQDVTKLRALERDALESERRFRSTIENAPIGMAVVAPGGLFLEVNRALAETLGYDQQDLAGRTFQDITHPDDVGADVESMRAMLAGEVGDYHAEKRYFHKSGREVWIELSVSLLRDEHGGPVHFISQMKDITAERAAREALAASERRYQSIAANIPGVVYRFAMTPDGEFSLPFASAGTLDIYGLEPEQAMSCPELILGSVHLDEQAAFHESIAASAAELSRWEWHGRHVMTDGEIKYLHGVSQPFREPDGTVVWDGVIFDETEFRLAEAKEAETTQRLQSIMENLAGSAVTLYDREQRLRFCEGPLFASSDLDSMLGRRVTEFVTPGTGALLTAGMDKAFAGEASTAVVEADREGRALAVHFAPFRLADGSIDGALVHWHDITAVRSAERARDEAQGRFQAAFECAPIGMVLVGLDGRFERVNAALCEMTGYSEEELLAMTPFGIVHADDRERVQREFGQIAQADTLSIEHRISRGDGQVAWIQAHVTMIRDDAGEPVHALAQVQDITERLSHEEHLKHMADHDPLTGLLNRRAFEAALEAHVARCRRYGATGALLVVDLDGFKLVNDSRGHAAGDELIVECAGALATRLRETDTIARLGGDEFAILLPGEGRKEAETVAQALIETIRERGTSTGETDDVRVTASVGITLFGDDGLGAGELLVHADLAMYAAKNAGKDRYAVSARDGRALPSIAA